VIGQKKIIVPVDIKYAYPIRYLLNNLTTLIFGSDWYVQPPIPIQGILAAVTRQTFNGKNPNGWIPDQKISFRDALAAFTFKPPQAMYKNLTNIKLGQITEDYIADFTVLQNPYGNLLDVSQKNPKLINETRVLFTVFNGKIVYENKDT